MVNLRTTFMGLELKNPLIVGSSGLTNSVENIIEFEKKGAAAVVLKSLFEEQILHEVHHTIRQDELNNQYPEALDYIGNYSRENSIGKYLELIHQCKKAVKIPIIASINCFTTDEWISYAKKMEEAGADAIELNVFVLPSDPMRNSERNEKLYFSILDAVLKQVKIPVSLKISYYFSALAETVRKLDWAGVKGLVLFNRFYSPDIDIDTLKVIPSHVFSDPTEISIPLRWIALLAGGVKCDIVGSTGVHTGKDMVKLLLAGACAVEVVSSIYKNGNHQITIMINELEEWMVKNGFNSIADFKGKLSYKQAENPAAYERVQFMKHFAGIE
jgi:dihydroorotate dehydrogenase (fumarate)